MNSYKSLWSRDLDIDKLKYAYLTFSGRASRREYWEVLLFATAVAIVGGLVAIVALAVGSDYFAFLGGGIMLLASVACVPVCVRRLHDRNMSWWWLLVFIVLMPIPYIGIIASVAYFVIVGCLDGTCGPNRYGQDAKSRASVTAQQSSSTFDGRLAELGRLKAAGVISQEEYSEQRNRILSGI